MQRIRLHSLQLKYRREPIVDLHYQSHELDDKSIRCSLLCNKGKPINSIFDGVETCLDAIYHGASLSGTFLMTPSPVCILPFSECVDGGDCVGYHDTYKAKYVWTTYNEAIWRAKYFGSGLINLGCKLESKSLIGIYAINSVEWFIAQYACYHYSMVVIPLYDTLGTCACSYIINEGEIETVVVDSQEKLANLLNQSQSMPSLKNLVCIDRNVPESLHLRAKEKEIKIFTFKEVEPPKPEDMAMVMYTSGTTGTPKGAILLHRNFIASASGLISHMAGHIAIKDQTILSFLPMAHSFEQATQTAMILGGGRIGFYSGDVRNLTKDLKSLRPTTIIVVPRLLTRIYNKVITQVKNSALKAIIFRKALQSKEKEIERFLIRHNSIWDKIIFKKLRKNLGGNLKIMACGSAPLSSTILRFFRCALGCLVIEGYGQTECCGPASTTFPGDFSVEHVGPPMPCCQIKLIDVPEMNYFVEECGMGEVCVKGANVFSGYFKNDAKTREVLDENNWLHTGDIGIWNPNGTLKLVDRKKHIFKLAQGEYIAPEKIENIYCQSPYVAQCYVEGNSLKDFIVAVVVPDVDHLNYWCAQRSINLTLEDACKNRQFKRTVFEDLVQIGKREGLFSFEQVKDIYLHCEPFAMDNDLVTPTMKTKRLNCRTYFAKQIEEMYQNVEEKQRRK